MNESIISDNIGLVHACAGKFKGKGVEYDDLFQAGCLGLIKAAQRFDNSRGIRFSTYAVPVILGEIRGIFRNGSTVKVSRSLKELSLKASRASSQFAGENGREPTVSELAQMLDVSCEKLNEAMCASQAPVSLTMFDSAESSDSKNSELDLPVESQEERITDLLALRQIITELTEDDRKIIYLRFFKNLTQSKTAQELNTTQVQISRRESKIIAAMRRRMLG